MFPFHDLHADAFPLPPWAIPEDLSPREKRILQAELYKAVVDSGDPEMVFKANKAIVEQVWQIASLLFYDPTGGEKFEPSDKAWRQALNQYLYPTIPNSKADALTTVDGTRKAIRDLLSFLQDPYTEYIPPNRVEQVEGRPSPSQTNFQNRIRTTSTDNGHNGNNVNGYEGATPPQQQRQRQQPASIGVQIALKSVAMGNKGPVSTGRGKTTVAEIVGVYPSSPAESCGLRIGDCIVSIDNTDVPKSVDEVYRRLEGPQGSGIKLTIQRQPTQADMTEVDTDISLVMSGGAGARDGSYEPWNLPLKVDVDLRRDNGVLPPLVAEWVPLQRYQDEEKGSLKRLLGAWGAREPGEGERIAYLRLHYFSRSTFNKLLPVLDAFERGQAVVDGRTGASLSERQTSANSPPLGYIIDLRNNYGGVFQEAMLIASLFLDDPNAPTPTPTPNPAQQQQQGQETAAVSTRMFGGGGRVTDVPVLYWMITSWPNRESGSYLTKHTVDEFHFDRRFPNEVGSIRNLRRPPPPTPPTAEDGTLPAASLSPSPPSPSPSRPPPVVVLVNRGTASAAEIFAAALRDNGRAVVVGERTYGKSLIQHFFPLPDGGALKLTIAEYLTPKRQHVSPSRLGNPYGGIAPDLLCLASPTGDRGAPMDVCTQMAALRILRSENQ